MIEVRDSGGTLFRFNAKSYRYETGMGGVVFTLFAEPDCRGEFLAAFVNPRSVVPMGSAQ